MATIAETGISPAHAGNTSRLSSDWALGWDQPRTCGEYVCDLQERGLTGGSAPHMRGIQNNAPL